MKIRILNHRDILEHNIRIEPHDFDQPAFFMINKGEAILKHGSQTVLLSCNSLFIITTGSKHQLLISEEFEGRFIIFQRELIEKVTMKLSWQIVLEFFQNFLFKKIILSDNEMEILNKNIDLLETFLISKTTIIYKSKIIESYFYAFIYQLLSFSTVGINTLKNSITTQDIIVYKFILDVVENFKINKDVSFYAKKQKISSSRLSVTVKNITNKTSKQIIDEFITNEAKTLLKSTALSLSEIAEKLKFCDQYSFSSFFKKHTGLFPLSYRKMIDSPHPKTL